MRRERVPGKVVLELYQKHVIAEASASTPYFVGAFLLTRRVLGNRLEAHVLFVHKTEAKDFESLFEIWFNIYTWIKERTLKLLSEYYELGYDYIIMLYPRFMSLDEYQELPEEDKVWYEKRKIVWINERQSSY